MARRSRAISDVSLVPTRRSVQDGARRGERMDDRQTVSRLSFVGSTIDRAVSQKGGRAAAMVMAITLGAAWTAWLIAWLIGP